MKHIIILIFVLTFCENKKVDFEKKIIGSFCTEVILNHKASFNDTTNYIEYSNTFLQNERKHTIVMSILNDIKNRILKSNKYEIINHKDLLKTPNFKEVKFSNEYKNSNTFHLISNDSLITSFITKNKKIISFTSNIIKTKNPD